MSDHIRIVMVFFSAAFRWIINEDLHDLFFSKFCVTSKTEKVSVCLRSVVPLYRLILMKEKEATLPTGGKGTAMGKTHHVYLCV